MPEQLHILTPSMRAQLRALWLLGATSYETARAPYAIEGFNEQLLAILQRFELVARRNPTPRPGSKPKPLFYLTAAGVAEARKPSEAQR